MKILMVGASLDQKGGIATVEKLLLKHIHFTIQIKHITSHDEGSIMHRFRIFWQAWLTMILELLFGRVDVLHVHLSDGGSLVRKVIISLTGFTFQTPVIMHTHGAEFHTTFERLPRWAQQLVALTFRQCETFIVLSKTWKTYYVTALGLDPERVLVLPNPVELPLQMANRQSSNPIKLIFCGRIGERKGAFDLIRAFSQLPSMVKADAELYLAGDGELAQAQHLVESLHLTQQVKFLGWLNATQCNQLFAQADIFALPSYNEGLPMALLEAMGRGLAVVATPVGGIPELVTCGKNGLLAAPGDIDQLTAHLQVLIQSQPLRTTLGKVARESVQPFEIQQYCASLTDLYSSVSQRLSANRGTQ